MTLPRFTLRSALFVCLALFSLPIWGQDTRGSLVPDTLILMADGTLSEAEDLRVGALVKVWLPDGKPGAAKITATRRQNVAQFILLKAGEVEFRANGSHRVALPGGKLVRLDTLKVGDSVWLSGPQGPVAAAITSLRVYPANMVAHDLTVEGHLPFIASGLIVGD